jgi:hypothetical protein
MTEEAVPERYRGVWLRRLLETPELRDDTTTVRWLQTSRWHADLRLPVAARSRSDAQGEAQQQGFAGTTAVGWRGEGESGGEVCTWRRELDFQPPGPHPDEGWMQFESDDRVIETGVHGVYREVWERLPDSTHRFIALGRAPDIAGTFTQRLLVAGRYLMRVRAREAAWPADAAPGERLADLVVRHPGQAAAWLDFEISFGVIEQGVWTVQHSTLPELEGLQLPLALERIDASTARVTGAREDIGSGHWQLNEWRWPSDRHPL